MAISSILEPAAYALNILVRSNVFAELNRYVFSVEPKLLQLVLLKAALKSGLHAGGEHLNFHLQKLMHSTVGQMTICTERSVDKEPMAPRSVYKFDML